LVKNRLKRILVALDGSDIGYKAISYSVDLTKGTGASLAIMHVISPPVVQATTVYDRIVLTGEAPLTVVPLPESTHREVTREGLEVLERSRMLLAEAGVKADFIVAHGNPVEEILREARKGYDLLILGFEGVGKRTFGIGSVGSRVLEKAPCSVMVVK